MIVLVWSLVSSVVEAARRRRLAIFLRHFYADATNQKSMLVCRRLRQTDSYLSPSPSSGRLARFTSEPQLHTQQLVYRTEKAELAVESAVNLHATEWRFVDILSPSEDDKVFFVASIGRLQPDEEQPPQAVFLDSCCIRVAWHKLQPASLYCCDIEQLDTFSIRNNNRFRFVDIVYAFSEGALFENNTSALVENLHTIFPDSRRSISPAHSSNSSGSVLAFTQKRPLPLLEQLFWGDKTDGIQKVTMRYGSENALHNGHYGSLPRRSNFSPRRRYRSCNTSYRSTRDLYSDSISSPVHNFFDPSTQLPPFLRNFDRERTYSLYKSITDLPYVDDSAVTSPLAITDAITSSYAALVYRETTNGKRAKEEEEVVAEQVENHKTSEEPVNGLSIPIIEESLKNIKESGTTAKEENSKQAKILAKPPAPIYGSARYKRTEQHSCPPPASISRRRHSAMVQSLADTTFNFAENGRHRSVSPMPLGDTLNGRRRSLKNSIFTADSGSIEFPKSYTPSRRFYCRRMSVSEKVMAKPPSILVYTGEQHDLYGRIRTGLSRLLPTDRYTVFNISAAAVKKQPWIEKTTACLVLATTDNLDDTAWAKIQAYFNQAGKLIFMCQNRLLASLTSCESSKKQADILRMALGHHHSAGMGKDFESFLKKSLKTLNKHGTVNETFRSKDLTGGVSYSVILSKTKGFKNCYYQKSFLDTPLILYMENSAHQAAAVFSDATPDQLLAPGSKILRDALSRVGVVVHEHEVPSTSTGLLLTQNEAIISSIQGIRYGENISKSPELFLRREEAVEEQGLPSPSKDLLPIQVGHRDPSTYSQFNFARYFSRLNTNRLGQICLHVPVATTTIDIILCDAIPSLDGAVVIANQQIFGQGRGGNEFVSPLGAAMFTFSMEIPRNSTVAKEAGFVQHILAVAICDAVRSLSGVDDFPLRIKWPNDLYYNRSHKMGGILAKAKSGDYKMSFQLSAGLNVTNSQPTCCLNDIIPENQEFKFTIEDVIAETLNKFEVWLNRYELKGRIEFLNKYYEFWLHDREEVVLEEVGEKVMIRGLDENGFLQVRSKRSPGKLISVWDNGNTFDMMKGLIRQKL